MDKKTGYANDSLTLTGAVALGTGVMIGAGIFSLTGQMAEMAGSIFPYAFLAAAFVVSVSAHSYVILARAYPSAGGIGMFLHKAYGHSVTTAFHALLMYSSMVIAQSFLARTFGAYAIQLFEVSDSPYLATAFGVGLVLFAFFVNLMKNSLIQGISSILGIVKVVGIAIFAVVGIVLVGEPTVVPVTQGDSSSVAGFLGGTALGILAFKGFTTITNSGDELVDAHKNVGRAIIISIGLCILIYILVGIAVSSNLSLSEIIETKDYSLAAAARPVFGDWGVRFTAVLAMVATAGGIIASVFAVSRMLAMLSDMKLVPHKHFGLPGDMQKHTLVYTTVFALVLTAFFDLSRIAALGIIFYLVMDMAIHWGVLRHLREKVDARVSLLVTAIILDLIVLGAFVLIKFESDKLILVVAVSLMVTIWLMETMFLRSSESDHSFTNTH